MSSSSASTLVAGDDAAIQLSDDGSGRYDAATRTIAFDHTNWNVAVRVNVQALDDFVAEDPETAVLKFVKDITDCP